MVRIMRTKSVAMIMTSTRARSPSPIAPTRRSLSETLTNSFDFKCADSSELFFFGLKLASVSFLSVST